MDKGRAQSRQGEWTGESAVPERLVDQGREQSRQGEWNRGKGSPVPAG